MTDRTLKNVDLKNDEFTLENEEQDVGYDLDWEKESRFLYVSIKICI